MGCLSRTSRVEPPPVALRTASLDELLQRLDVYRKLHSMKATVNLQLSYFNEERNRRTALRDVRGFVLAQRPDNSRIQAQYPVTRQKAFDMVSNGKTFQVYLVWQGRFFTGENNITTYSKKRAENIRPQHVVKPLMISPPQPDETAVLDNVTEGQVLYHVVQLQRGNDGTAVITRKFFFNRADLQLSRLEIYDDKAQVVTVARYSSWMDDEGIPYPRQVSVSRPTEGYSLSFEFLDPGLNEDLPENAFELEPPKGVKIEVVGSEADASSESAEAQ